MPTFRLDCTSFQSLCFSADFEELLLTEIFRWEYCRISIVLLSSFFLWYITQKVYGIHEQSAYQMTALLSEIFLFLVRVARKLRMVSYGSEHTLWPLFYTPFCAYLHTKLRNYRLYKNVLPIKQLLYYWRYLFSWLELDTSYDWRVMDPNTHCNHFSVQHFVLNMEVLHIKWVLYYRRCLFFVLKLDARYKWQVMVPNMYGSVFSISHLCVLTCITWKLRVNL